MSSQLKAAELREEAPQPKQFNATVLRSLEGRNGFVFALVSINGRASETSIPASTVLEHVDRLTESFGKDANAQHRFEQFLSALNETVAERVRNGDWNVPIEQFNAIVGVACDEQMFLSGTGDLTALFLHRTPQQRYQVFNLFRSIQTEQSLPTWEKTFAVVLDGELHSGDVFCVSNRDLPRFVASEELNAVLSTLPPQGAAEKIRQYFPTNSDLSLLILQSVDSVETPSNAAHPLASLSIDHLVRTKNETEEFLEDQKPRPITGILETLKKMRLPVKRLAAGRSVWRLVSSSAMVALHMLLGSAKWTTRTTVSLAKRDTRSQILTAIRTGTDHGIRSIVGRFNRLPKMTKTLMMSAIGILFVLTTSISVLQRAQVRSAESAAYQKKVTAVEDTIEKATGAIIYKDEIQARKFYSEALALAQALPTDTDERTKTANDLQQQINGAFNELRHLATIPQPTLLGELDASNGVTGRAVFASGGGIYVIGSDKRAYLLDPSARSLAPLETSDGEIGIPAEVTSENGQILFIDGRPGVSRLDLENKLLQITNVQPVGGTRWTDLSLYGGKLYVLEPSSGQIIKYNRAGSDFDGGTRWIRAKSTDLSDAVSMAIDATVFVLKQNGQIIRFVSGSEVGWTQASADPAITAATDIWTSAESAYVYVLEPSTQRLIVYKKEGGDLVTQYRSDAFQGLTDFLVDETNKTIYLLAGSSLYSITASHLR
ncbi:hypothetical protein A2348_05220 [Candidatus Uhrbacteria bacterium RIFOXYB12_FULL_58_10]|nr:MAG: hypothetical protein A2348_05220 [Candidatus Uhrbacteria bacterium RIFOXYB12_FULL_58_10]